MTEALLAPELPPDVSTINHTQIPFAMNAKISSLLALALTFSAALANAQSFELYAPRGGNNISDNGGRIITEAQQDKGYGFRINDNEGGNDAYAKAKTGAFYIKATVLIYGQTSASNFKRIIFAKGQTKQIALSNLRTQVNAIGANAKVVKLQFLK